jgi:hypothetical protein
LAPAQEKTAIQTAGEEVLVDVVVRDKKGHSVTSLSQNSFTVLDEGVPRQISSFRLVKGTEAVSAAASGTTTTEKLDPVRQIRLVTLIFDRLDQSERTASATEYRWVSSTTQHHPPPRQADRSRVNWTGQLTY